MGAATTTALIAAGPGDLRDSLRAMLVSVLPRDVEILEADDAAMAERLLHEHHPRLVVVDADLPGNHAMQLVEAARAEGTSVRCSILVDNVRQHAAAMKAGREKFGNDLRNYVLAASNY